MIKCRINSRQCNALVNSESDVNVVKKDFLKKHFNITPQCLNSTYDHALKCANSSEIKICGRVNLMVEIGPQIKKVSFLVVENIMPEIILGMKCLNVMKVDIITTKNAVKCCGVLIPFNKKLNEQKNARLTQ